MVTTRQMSQNILKTTNSVLIIDTITGDINQNYIKTLSTSETKQLRSIIVTSLPQFISFINLHKLTSANKFSDIIHQYDQYNRIDNTCKIEYDGFCIANQSHQNKVISFLKNVNEMRHITAIECPIRAFFNERKNSIKIHLKSTLTINELNNMLAISYNIPEMWEGLHNVRNVDDPAIYKYLYWVTEMKEIFTRLFSKCLESFYAYNCIEKRTILTFKLSRLLIRYDKLLTNKYIPGGLGHGRLLYTIIYKLLEWININGLRHAFLVFAHYMPDMVSDDCYPALNTRRDIHNYADIEEIQFDETDPDFGVLLTKYKKYFTPIAI